MLGSTQIRCTRKELSISQSDLAAASGIARKRVSAIELGSAITDSEQKQLIDGFAAIRAEAARKLVAPILRRGPVMDSNEIENLEAKRKHCEERIISCQGALTSITKRESLARDGLALIADATGTKAAHARRTFSAVLGECAEDRTEAQRLLDVNTKLLEQTKRFLRESQAQADANVRERKVDQLLRDVGEIKSIV